MDKKLKNKVLVTKEHRHKNVRIKSWTFAGRSPAPPSPLQGEF